MPVKELRSAAAEESTPPPDPPVIVFEAVEEEDDDDDDCAIHEIDCRKCVSKWLDGSLLYLRSTSFNVARREMPCQL